MVDASANEKSGRITPWLLWVVVVAGAVLVGAAGTAVFLGRVGGQTDPPVTLAPGAGPDANGSRTEEATGVSLQSAQAAPAERGELSYEDVERVVGLLGEEERTRVLEDETAFTRFVAREVLRRSVLAAARSAGLSEDERIELAMQRGAEKVLVDAFVRLRTRGAIAADFPSAAQVEQVYEENKERFRVGARVPVWQIFFAVAPEAGEAAWAAAEREAREVAARIRDGGVAFEDAVARHSDHAPSRVTGGFMGTLAESTLRPEVREVLPGLAQGELSDPVRGEAGVHLIRRGARMPARILPLEDVRARIRASLRRAARTKLRQVVLAEAHKAHGTSVDKERIERWRTRLRDSLGAGGPEPSAAGSSGTGEVDPR